MTTTANLSRRHLLLMGATLCTSSRTLAASTDLPLATSLPNELAQALQHGQALVVMISLANCPFCKVVRQNYLIPLQVEQNMPVVQLDMYSMRIVQGLNGVSLSHENLRRSWGIKIAPTVLFFGAGGAEVAPRLVGASIPDFYGAYLDQRLQQAQAAIRRLS
jgi:thioredoxin-related protein